DRSVPSVTVRMGGPIANNDWMDTDGSNPVAVDVLANDSVTAQASRVTVVARPLHGTAVANRSTGEITYVAFAGFTGSDTFRYTVADSSGFVSNVAIVTVQVNRPVANDDWIDTDGSTPVTIEVLENDSDPDGNEHIDPSAGGIVT